MKTLGYLALPLVGALALYAFAWPTDPIIYTDVVVPARVIIEREPPARPPTVIERIRYVTLPPVQRATAPQGAAADVDTFCRPTVLALTDTVEVPVPDPVLLLRSVTHSPGWLWQRDRLFLAGPTSHGDLRAFDYWVRPGWSARTVGDSLIVRQPRTALLRELLEVGLTIGAWEGLGWVAERVGR